MFGTSATGICKSKNDNDNGESKRGDSNHKMKQKKKKKRIWHDLLQKSNNLQYCCIKMIKLFDLDRKSQLKMNNYSYFLF